MAINQIIDALAWFGILFIMLMLTHLFTNTTIFTDSGLIFVYKNIIGLIFGIIAGKYIYAWYQAR